MGILKKYSEKEGYYLKHTHAIRGKLFHTTYQVTKSAESFLLNKGYRDGKKVPKALIHQLLAEELIFTGEGGPRVENFEPEDRDEVQRMQSLTPKALSWVFKRLEMHPHVKTSITDKEPTVDVTYHNVPDHLFPRLLAIAERFDGTDFLLDLDNTYKKFSKTDLANQHQVNCACHALKKILSLTKQVRIGVVSGDQEVIVTAINQIEGLAAC